MAAINSSPTNETIAMQVGLLRNQALNTAKIIRSRVKTITTTIEKGNNGITPAQLQGGDVGFTPADWIELQRVSVILKTASDALGADYDSKL